MEPLNTYGSLENPNLICIFGYMPSKKKPNEWMGTEGVLRRGEPILTFNRPYVTRSIQQKSYAMWNWKDKTLAITIWVRYDNVIDSGKTKNICSRYLRELFKPDRQMCISANECLKSDGKYICNFQYFAKLDKCPIAEVMIKAFNAFEEKAVPMSQAEYEKRRLDRYHGNYYEKYKQERLWGFDPEEDEE